MVIFLLFQSGLGGQSLLYFNNEYDFHPNGESSFSVVAAYGHYYTCGSGLDVSGYIKIDVACMDTAGNLLWNKSYGQPSSAFYCGSSGSLIATSDGGFAVGGTLESSASTEALLMKLDSNGDTLWTKTFGNDSICSAYQCKQTSDGGYVLVGATDINSYWEDVLLIKTDSLGNEQWRRTYGNSNQEIGMSVTQTFDGGYLLGGDYQQIGGDEDEYVIKVDSLGNFQWQRYLGGIYDDGNAFVVQLADSNFAIGGTLTINQPGGPGIGNPYGKANIIKLDRTGATVWNKVYGAITFNTTITTLMELPDGSLVGAGFFGGTYNMEGFVLKTDSAGDSLFLRSYNYYWNNHDYFYDIKATSDNGFIISGCTLDNQGNTWLVKTDSLGCDTAGCNLLGIANENPTRVGFTVFPNPTNGFITINFRNLPSEGYRIVLSDALGNTIYTSGLLLTESTQIDLPYATGFYILHIKTSDGCLLDSETIIRQ